MRASVHGLSNRRYESVEEVSSTLAVLERAHGRPSRFEPYVCEDCSGWHLSAIALSVKGDQPLLPSPPGDT